MDNFTFVNKLEKAELICTLSLLAITITTGGILASSHVSADTTSSVTASVTVGSACNFTSSNGSYSATIANGNNEEIAGDAITVSCNDSNGYAIYAIGYSGDSYTNATHTDMITPLGDSYNIKTGGSGTYGSNWQMKLTAGTNATLANSFGSYQNIPGSFTKVASYSGSTTAGTITPTYKVSISSTQPAGTYVGKVKYTLVHPSTETPAQPQTATSGCINYFANASTAVGTMGCQSISASATSATLLASNFSRAGYGFAGWSDAFDYATNPNAHFYGPQEDITFTAGQYTGSNPGLALYAVWIESAGVFQSNASTVCDSLTTAPTDGTANLNSVSALTDARDNETYAIAKLADGNCWMIENLRLENTASHNTDGTLAQGYNSSFIGLANPETAGFTNSTTANSLYSTDGSTDATISGSYQGYRFPRYRNTNTSARASTPTTNSGAMYSYGNYYTWTAAIADTTDYNTNNQSVTTTSLCPAGWHLPTGGMAYASGSTTGVNVTGDPSTFREFYKLGYSIMNGTTAYEDTPYDGLSYYSSNTTNANGDTATKAFRKFPNNYLYSGYVNGGSVSYRGSAGYYWSPTAYTSIYAYYLYLYSSNVYPGTNSANKHGGRTVRCIAQ